MLTITEIREYLRLHPDTPIVILDIDDLTMATTIIRSADGATETIRSIINEAELAALLKDKIVCFATDKADSAPQEVIDFCERHQLMFASELYGLSAKLRQLFDSVKNTIIEQPLIEFIENTVLTKAAFEAAVSEAYSLYYDKSIQNASESNFQDIDNLCKLLTTLLIEKKQEPEVILSLLSEYYAFIIDLPNFRELEDKNNVVQKIYNQVISALMVMTHTGRIDEAIKLFSISQAFIKKHGAEYQGKGSMKHLSHIYDLDQKETYIYLDKENLGLAERSDIQSFLLNRMIFNDSHSVTNINNDLRDLLRWSISLELKANNSKIDNTTYKKIIGACVGLNKKIEAILSKLPDRHPLKSIEIYGLWGEALQSLFTPVVSASTSASTSTALSFPFEPGTPTDYYKSLGSDMRDHIHFCHETYPRLIPHDMFELPTKQVTGMSIPTPQAVTTRVIAHMEQLKLKIDEFVRYADGSIRCAIHIQGTDGVELIYKTTFPSLAAYQDFFSQKQPIFLYLMRELRVLPQGWEGRNIEYHIAGDEPFFEAIMYFADDSRTFCDGATVLGINHVIHGNTSGSMPECVKYLSILYEYISERSSISEINLDAIFNILPKNKRGQREQLEKALSKSGKHNVPASAVIWKHVQQIINDLFHARLKTKYPTQQSAFNTQLTQAADTARFFANIQTTLTDLYRFLPERFTDERLRISDAIQARDWQRAQQLIIELRPQVDLYPGNDYIVQLGGSPVAASRITAAVATNIIASQAFRESQQAYLRAEIAYDYPISRALGLEPDSLLVHTDTIHQHARVRVDRYAMAQEGYMALAGLIQQLDAVDTSKFKEIGKIKAVWHTSPRDIYYLAQLVTQVLQDYKKPSRLSTTKAERINIASKLLQPLASHLKVLVDLPPVTASGPSGHVDVPQSKADHHTITLAYEHILSAKNNLFNLIFNKSKLKFFIDSALSQRITIETRHGDMPIPIIHIINQMNAILKLEAIDSPSNAGENIVNLTLLTQNLNHCLVTMNSQLPDYINLKKYLLNIKKRLYQLEQLENNVVAQLLHGLPSNASALSPASSTSTQVSAEANNDPSQLTIVLSLFALSAAFRKHMDVPAIKSPELHMAKFLQLPETQARMSKLIRVLQTHVSSDSVVQQQYNARIITERLVGLVTGKQLHEFHKIPDAWQAICANPLYADAAPRAVMTHLLTSQIATPSASSSDRNTATAGSSSSATRLPEVIAPAPARGLLTSAGLSGHRLGLGSSSNAPPRSGWVSARAGAHSLNGGSSLFSHPSTSQTITATPVASSSSSVTPDDADKPTKPGPSTKGKRG